MLFDVPLLPDDDYIRFLTRQRKHLNSVYFSLNRPEIKDARYRLKMMNPDDLIPALRSIPGVPKFALLNSRVHPPGDYLDPEKVERAADTLRLFGQGTKVAVEIAIMAADGGALSGKDIVSIGGTGHGADTALILKPANQSHLFDMRIREVVCKPGTF